MHMITGAQVRMARSLLKWSSQRLAEESRVGRGTITTFEKDIAIRENLIYDLYCAFDAHGVEFTPDGGVKLRDSDVKDFRGVGSCDRFFAYLETTVKAKGGDVVCIVDSQSLLTKSTGQEKLTNLERMEQLNAIAPVKCLLTDNKIILPTRPSFEVRVLPEPPTSAASALWAYDKEYTHALEFDPRITFKHPVYIVMESAYHAMKVVEAFHRRWTFAKPYSFSNKAAKAA